MTTYNTYRVKRLHNSLVVFFDQFIILELLYITECLMCAHYPYSQVDPQSLKGTLSIVYKHEVNWLLGNLNKIGAIYVNGVRYPPDKNGGQGSRPNQSCGYQDPRSGAFTPTSPHLQYMANQVLHGAQIFVRHSSLSSSRSCICIFNSYSIVSFLNGLIFFF